MVSKTELLKELNDAATFEELIVSKLAWEISELIAGSELDSEKKNYMTAVLAGLKTASERHKTTCVETFKEVYKSAKQDY